MIVDGGWGHASTIEPVSGTQRDEFSPQEPQTMNQLTLPLELNLASEYRSLLDCVGSCVYAKGLARMAPKLDMSPSHLSEALAGGERGRKFGLVEFEELLKAGELKPLHYLVAKYLSDTEARRLAAVDRLLKIMEETPGLMATAGIKAPHARRR